MKGFFLCLALSLGALSACLGSGAEQGLRPLRDFRTFRLEQGERREVTGWLQLKDRLTPEHYAHIREETYTFTDGATGASYTVFDLRYRPVGHISADGRVTRLVHHRHSQSWRREDLGQHELTRAVGILLSLDETILKRAELVPMTLDDVIDG